MTKVKICGITNLQDIGYINKSKPDYAGFVIFFQKSKRNLGISTAKELLNNLDKSIKSVAVTVSPTIEQVKQIYDCGFDLIQIHGEASDEVLSNPYLNVLRAFNVTDIDNFDRYSNNNNIVGYVFDAAAPGSGKVFDWTILNNVPRDGKMLILAGGLTPENVANAVKIVKPDGVDVSSGVERDDGKGKSEEKVAEFIRKAKSITL